MKTNKKVIKVIYVLLLTLSLMFLYYYAFHLPFKNLETKIDQLNQLIKQNEQREKEAEKFTTPVKKPETFRIKNILDNALNKLIAKETGLKYKTGKVDYLIEITESEDCYTKIEDHPDFYRFKSGGLPIIVKINSDPIEVHQVELGSLYFLMERKHTLKNEVRKKLIETISIPKNRQEVVKVIKENTG